MNTQKIYLTIHEIETLCFLKCIQIPIRRLEILRAKGAFSFAVHIISEHFFPKPDLVILFSSVTKIEIPDTELNLFRNQFKIPIGLLATVSRKVKDSPPKRQQTERGDFADTGKIEKSQDNLLVQYVPIRRSLIQLLLYGYQKPISQLSISDFFKEFSKMSGFSKDLIEEITEQKKYPKLDGTTKKAEFYMYTWWGKFIIDRLLEPQKNQITSLEYIEHKRWFKKFVLENVLSNCANIQTVPILYQKYRAIIFGYFFAFMTENKAGVSIEDCLNGVHDEDEKNEILLWGIFFQNLFDEKIDFIFANPLVRWNFFTIESIAYNFSRCIHNEGREFIVDDFVYDNVNSEQLVEKYFELIEGKKGKKPEILNKDDLVVPFEKSVLFRRNRSNVFLINENINWDNKLIINASNFSLIGSLPLNGIATFYGNISIEDKKQLKIVGLNFKSKQLDSIIPKSKTVLIGFFTEYQSQSNEIWGLYTHLVNKKVTSIEEIIIVWLINGTDSRIKSTEFALEKNNMTDYLVNQFGVNVTLVIKNISDTNDTEIKHTLKVALRGMSFKTHVEVIDTNLEQRQLEWLINATNEYMVKTDDLDCHFFCNA